MRTRRRVSLLALTAAFAASACGHEAPTKVESSPTLAIVDGAHDGNPHFYFLKPFVPGPAPAPTGVFDAGQAATIGICELGDSDCTGPVAVLPIVDSVVIDPTNLQREGYWVDWDLDGVSLAINATYRIHVLIAGVTLGYADVLYADKKSDCWKSFDTRDESICLPDNKHSLTIKFRIEQGALPVPSGAIYPLDGNAREATGTYPDGVLYGTQPAADRFGLSSAALHFDGLYDSLVMPAGIVNGLAEGTVSFWMKLDDINRQYYVFSTFNYPPLATYGMALQFGGGTPEAGPIDRFYFMLNAEACWENFTGGCYVFPPTGSAFTEWHLYTVTWANGMKRIYMDETLLSETTGPSASPETGSLVFGATGRVRNEMLKGTLDDIRIYTTQLSAAEVATLFGGSN